MSLRESDPLAHVNNIFESRKGKNWTYAHVLSDDVSHIMQIYPGREIAGGVHYFLYTLYQDIDVSFSKMTASSEVQPAWIIPHFNR
jgi:hypothetical protein